MPGLTGNSMTVATEGSTDSGVPMEQGTSSGPATSDWKNIPRLRPLMRRTTSPTNQPNVTPW